VKIFKAGDQTNASCYRCEKFVPTTFKIRDVPVSEDRGVVKNILVGVCDNCDAVIFTPNQSTPAIKKHLDERELLDN